MEEEGGRRKVKGQGLARVDERGHPARLGAAVHRHTLDRVNAINDSLKKKKRKVKGTGMGRVVHWNCKARVNYVHCRTAQGNLATCFGRRHPRHPRPVPQMRKVCRDREACSPGLHTRRGHREQVGDVGGHG